MIIEKESPLRHLPADLDPKQATFLDGIRYAIEMADLAYSRLTQSLHVFATEYARGSETTVNDRLWASSFLDAWSIVDSVHRLRGLLAQLPQLKKSSPPYQVFERKTRDVEEMRNIVQHLNRELRHFAQNNLPVFGTIDWLTVINTDLGIVRSSVIVAGRAMSGTHQLCNPLGKRVAIPVDHITLTCKSRTVDVSGTISSITSIVSMIETSLRALPSETPNRWLGCISRDGNQMRRF